MSVPDSAEPCSRRLATHSLRPAVGAASLLALTLGVALYIIGSSPRDPTHEPAERAGLHRRSSRLP
jgi:hypothetical protein